MPKQKTWKTAGAHTPKTKVRACTAPEPKRKAHAVAKKTPARLTSKKVAPTASAKALRFAYARMPEDYPGNKVWWTIRFVGSAPDPAEIPGWERCGMTVEAGHHEWVDVAALRIGDHALGGTIIAFVALAGQPAFKVRMAHGTRIVARSTVEGEKVERLVQDPARNRELQVELDADLDDFDAREVEAFFCRVHEKFPLVAVLFQDGQFIDGEPLVTLDDAALIARLDGETAPKRLRS